MKNKNQWGLDVVTLRKIYKITCRLLNGEQDVNWYEKVHNNKINMILIYYDTYIKCFYNIIIHIIMITCYIGDNLDRVLTA